MAKSLLRAAVILSFSALLCAALIVMTDTAVYQNLPSMAWVALGAFGIQWLGFIPAFVWQTERYYDLMGSVTFVGSTSLAFYLAEHLTLTSAMFGAMVLIWTLRLGGFLFLRILQDGSDSRFDEIKPDFWRFFGAWTLQALWVVITASPAYLVILTAPQSLQGLTVVGIIVWAIGLIVETTADWQKRRHRKEQPNTFIQRGLWAWSRHPNYVGEITLWSGVFVAALPYLHDFQYVVILSPLMTYLLLTRVSGIPMLEKKALARWGDDPAYQEYRKRTRTLF